MSNLLPKNYTIPNFPFLSQRDNYYNPSGSCNVSAIAMCLKHRGIRGDGSYPQLEDQLYARCNNRGYSRHSPQGLKQLAESYPNICDDFTEFGTFDDVRKALATDIGCVIHGYFTKFGHIIVVKGYDERGLIVNDPWGEWNAWGYDHSVSGENLHYSYNLISRLCSPESIGNPSHIWLHKIGQR
jgi:uncharacterized protein YvpB